MWLQNLKGERSPICGDLLLQPHGTNTPQWEEIVALIQSTRGSIQPAEDSIAQGSTGSPKRSFPKSLHNLQCSIEADGVVVEGMDRITDREPQTPPLSSLLTGDVAGKLMLDLEEGRRAGYCKKGKLQKAHLRHMLEHKVHECEC